jgi:hypothetical protein
VKNRVIAILPLHPAFYQDLYELAIQQTWQPKGYVVDPPIWADNTKGDWISTLEKQMRTARLVIIDITEGTPDLFYAMGMAQRLQVDVVMITANPCPAAPPAMLGRCINYGRGGGRFSLVKLIKEMENLASDLPVVSLHLDALSQETLKKHLAEICKLWRDRVGDPQFTDVLGDEMRYEEAKVDHRSSRLVSDRKVTIPVKARAFAQVENSASYKRILQDIVNELFGQIVEIEFIALIGG